MIRHQPFSCGTATPVDLHGFHNSTMSHTAASTPTTPSVNDSMTFNQIMEDQIIEEFSDDDELTQVAESTEASQE